MEKLEPLKRIKNIKSGKAEKVTVQDNFVMHFLDYDTDKVISISKQIIPISKGDYLTINRIGYEVCYLDINFDCAIIEVIITES